MTEEILTSWHDTPTRQAIVDFVGSVTAEGGPHYVPPSERIAVYDNDGTLWCEKPMPIELGFILARLADMAERDASLRTQQPWQAAWEKDYGWIGASITKHYHGDDADVHLLMGGMLKAFAGQSVEGYSGAADAFLRAGRHPTLDRAFHECGYLPMIELLSSPNAQRPERSEPRNAQARTLRPPRSPRRRGSRCRGRLRP